MHSHHIVPRHVGGSDDPSNLVHLTVEQHAEEHRRLFELHGRWEDEMAWKGLSGLIRVEVLHQEIARQANIGNRNAAKPHGGNAASWKGKKLPEAMKKKISNTLRIKGIKPPMFTGHTQESKNAIGRASLGTRYITDGFVTKKIKPGMVKPAGFEYGMAKRAA